MNLLLKVSTARSMHEMTGNRVWSGRAEISAWILTAGLIVLTVMKGGRFAAALLFKLYEIFIKYNTAGLV